MRGVYLVLCILGTLLPLSQFVPFLLEHGLAPGEFLGQLFATRISAFFGLDVAVSAVVLCAFVVAEGRRLGMRRLWLYFVATFGVGVSLGLPLFLLAREGHRQ